MNNSTIKGESFQTVWAKAIAYRRAKTRSELLKRFNVLQHSPSFVNLISLMDTWDDLNFDWEMMRRGITDKSLLEEEMALLMNDNFEPFLITSVQNFIDKSPYFTFSVKAEDLSFEIHPYLALSYFLLRLLPHRMRERNKWVLISERSYDNLANLEAVSNQIIAVSRLLRDCFKYPLLFFTIRMAVALLENMRERISRLAQDITPPLISTSIPLEYEFALAGAKVLEGIIENNSSKFQEAKRHLENIKSFLLNRDDRIAPLIFLKNDSPPLASLINLLLKGKPRKVSPRFVEVSFDGKRYLYHLIIDDSLFTDGPLDEEFYSNPLNWMNQEMGGDDIQKMVKRIEGGRYLQEVERFSAFCDEAYREGMVQTFLKEIADKFGGDVEEVKRVFGEIRIENRAIIGIVVMFALNYARGYSLPLSQALKPTLDLVSFILKGRRVDGYPG